jgi:hypothetical protein
VTPASGLVAADQAIYRARIEPYLKAHRQPSPPPLPSSRWIAGFPKDADSAASLRLPERIKLRLIADWIVQCNQPGAYPVVRITAVGHAEAREPYPKAVSLKRANSVLEALRSEIRDSALEDRKKEDRKEAVSSGLNPPPLETTIQFQTRFFGSIANKRTVELIFERDQYVVPSASPFFIMQAIDKVRLWAEGRFPPAGTPLKWWKLPRSPARTGTHGAIS